MEEPNIKTEAEDNIPAEEAEEKKMTKGNWAAIVAKIHKIDLHEKIRKRVTKYKNPGKLGMLNLIPLKVNTENGASTVYSRD